MTSGPLVEVAGVAGAGKSTLTRLLLQDEGRFRRGPFIRTRTPSHLALVARSLRRLLPILAVNLVRTPRLSWADFKLMAYVTEWERFVGGRRTDDVSVFDQGPVYALVRLEAQGRGVATHPAFRRWWNEMIAARTAALTAIVWLDAADDVLRVRIDQRDQAHVVKGESVDTSLEFITRYRALFEQVLHECERAGRPRLLRFDTGRTPAGHIADEVRDVLAAQPPR